MKRLFLIYFLFISNLEAVEFIGKFTQGSFILGKTDPKNKIFIDKKKVKVTKDGYFAFGLGRDRKNDVLIKVKNENFSETIEKKSFQTRI